jgi:hypothetical protein
MALNIKLDSDWQQIVYKGVESEELEYKAAMNWLKLDRAKKSRFARHCMAMANTKGGYIVIGVGEDKSGKPCVYTGLTERQAKSFDPTDVGNFVNRFAEPAVDFDVERPLIDGRRYVIFSIRRFSLIPHVCCASCNSELQQGFFYIRTVDASSRPAFKASEVHELIQRALRNQREHLGRMLRGILYENRKSLEPEAKRQFTEQVVNSKLFFEKLKKEYRWQESGIWEFSVFPPDFTVEKFSLSDVRRSAEKSAVNPIGSPFLDANSIDESYFTNVSFRMISKKGNSFLQSFSSGLVHYAKAADPDKDNFNYGVILKFVTDAVLFLGKYYYELGYADELLSVMLKVSGMENKNLFIPSSSKIAGKKKKPQYICKIQAIEIKIQRSAADLISGAAAHSAKIFTELCERFNFPEGQHPKLIENIAKYIEKGTF